MHKLGLGIVAAATVLSIAAFAQSGDGIGDYCNANGDFGVPHDVCVACVNNYETAVCQCKLFQAEDPAAFNDEFSNLGACINYAHSLGLQ